MDLYEETAKILEEAQLARFLKELNEGIIDFFEDPKEMAIFERIKELRSKSKTYLDIEIEPS